MANRTRQFLRRLAVLLCPFCGNQTIAARPTSTLSHYFSFVADEQMSTRAHFKVVFEFFGSWWTQTAVIPDKFQWRHLATHGEFIRDHGSQWIRLLIHPR